MKVGLLFLALTLTFFFGAQTAENVAVDSLAQVKDTGHSVKKATILSAVLPGAGQVYNHLAMPKGKKNAYWKVPLIYAALGGTGYLLLKENGLQRELKKEYKTRAAGNNGLAKYEQYDLQGIETLYNQHLNQRDLMILAFGAVYLLQVVDAAVEAHFVRFDISEDLTLHVSPSYLSAYQPGVKLSLKFK
ncbi:MAG: DUF5683 domain-containing protein [Bacteroidota bacterium]